jgi:contactin associated protein-like 2
MNLDGKSLVIMDLKRRMLASSEEIFRFRFRTSEPNGTILYAQGSQSDLFHLQLQNNRLTLDLNLGDPSETNLLTAGSLLDDDLWHDVMVSRRNLDLFFVVDRVQIRYRLKGEFMRLNLDNEMFIGGLPYSITGSELIKSNFTGCLENLMLNASNLISELKQDSHAVQYRLIGAPTYACRQEPSTQITFQTYDAHLKLEGFFQPSLNCSFQLRTFNEEGVLLHNKFSSDGFVLMYLNRGRLMIQLQAVDTPSEPIILEPFPGQRLNDGRWHAVSIDLSTDRAAVQLNNQLSITRRRMRLQSGLTYLLAGGVYGKLGFVGCMRHVHVQNRAVNFRSLSPDRIVRIDSTDIVFDSCHMTDHCSPNPCEHDGQCRQTHLDFKCDCSRTGYTGAVCHVSSHPLSCDAYRILYPNAKHARIHIDVDGSGPLAPFPVECEFPNPHTSRTLLHHALESGTLASDRLNVAGQQERVSYDAGAEQIVQLVNRSIVCYQSIRYECFNMPLLRSPYDRDAPFAPAAFWLSRNHLQMDYWGGSLSGSRKCSCGLHGTCKDSRYWCNCDSPAMIDQWMVDEGELNDKQHLPVAELHVLANVLHAPLSSSGAAIGSGYAASGRSSPYSTNSTQIGAGQRAARISVGPLVCEGDSLLSNVITFRRDDAVLRLPGMHWQHQTGDVYLQFKTTAENGVLLHARGPTHFIKLALSGPSSVQFSFHAGNGVQELQVQAAYRLSDNRWHSLLLERNRKQVRLTVDGKFVSDVRNGQAGASRPLQLTSPLVLGGTVDEREGYVGCVRSLLIDGQFMDLLALIRGRSVYGITTGCAGRCESRPCLNNGTCIERYSSYACDCQWTAFKGPICADEIGVNLRSDTFIRYDFENTISTIEEHIRVGFTTIEHKGLIFGVSSHTGEYLNLVMSTSGNLRLVFDFGFERQEIIIRNENFVLGQHHDLTIKRSDHGSKVTIWVDNYEPIVHTFKIGGKADAQFNKLKSIYIGRNESMDSGAGFVGCISRVSFDDHFPLRRLFQENRRDNVRAYPDQDAVREDTCGIEPYVHPTEAYETKPAPPGVAVLSSSTAGSLLLQMFLILLVLTVLGGLMFVAYVASGKLVARHKGDYVTQEDKGAKDADDADMAAVKGKTGADVIKKQEYFI